MNPQIPNFVPTMAPPANEAAQMVISPVKYVNTLAERVYANGIQAGTIRLPTTGGAQPTAAQKKVELETIARQLGLRTSYAGGGNATKIVTNHLTFVAPDQIYVYILEMVRDWDSNHQNRPDPVKKQWDKLQMVDIVAAGGHLWRQHLHASRNFWVTDGDLIWSTVPLFGLTQAAQAPLTLFDPAPPMRYHNETGIHLTVRQVQVRYNQTIPITNTPVGALFYDTTAPTYSDSLPGILTRGLNALLTRHARANVGPGPNQNTLSGINRSFENHAVANLDAANRRTVMAMQGYFLSVRPGVEKLFININHATSPFLESILVSDFIARARQLGRTMAEIQALLKGVKVSIRYNINAGWPAAVPSARHRFIQSVGDSSISQQRPNPNFNPTPNVHAWYAANSPWNQDPNFPNPALNMNPNALAINCGKDAARLQRQVEWIPADQLLILPWQAFKGRLTGDETNEMITNAMRNPRPHQNDLTTNGPTPASIRGGLAHFGFTAQAHNPQQGFLGRVGITAGQQFVQVDARTLQAPTVVYRRTNLLGTTNAQIRNASWNLTNVAFATSPPPMQELLILRVGYADTPNGFGKTLWNQLCLHGLIPPQAEMIVVERTCHPPGGADAALTQRWEQVLSTGLRSFPAVQKHLNNQVGTGNQATSDRGPVVVVIIPRKNYDDYACIKRVGDLQLGINTICVAADKLRGTGWNLQKASNLALKFNIKGSAITHTLRNPHLAVLRKTGQQAGSANTLVLGADVAHPTKGCLNGTPSISAVVGTVDDDFMQYGGSMRLQRGRKEEIGFLQEMVEERIIGWAVAHKNQLPANILFYRDGVSESQYEMVRTHEIPQIQNAINEADRRLRTRFGGQSTAPPVVPPPTLPPTPNRQQRVQAETTAYRQWANNVMMQPNNIPCKITFVVVGKRHNTRFYPTPGGPTISRDNDNCPPGLAVDRVITHPTSMDFYLQSHHPIKGTGRSAHYFAIQNGMDLTIDQLQGITHTFCYAYARATRAVSYCAPAYYADKLCDRGRAYIRPLLVGKTPHTLTLCPMPAPPAPQLQTWPPRRQNQPAPNQAPFNPPETYEQYMNAMAEIVATEHGYFRGWRTAAAQHLLYGQERKLPWHRNLDTTMFWL